MLSPVVVLRSLLVLRSRVLAAPVKVDFDVHPPDLVPPLLLFGLESSLPLPAAAEQEAPVAAVGLLLDDDEAAAAGAGAGAFGRIGIGAGSSNNPANLGFSLSNLIPRSFCSRSFLSFVSCSSRARTLADAVLDARNDEEDGADEEVAAAIAAAPAAVAVPPAARAAVANEDDNAADAEDRSLDAAR